MITELAKLVDTFQGPINQTRCFLHIVNLVARTTIRLFDPPSVDKTASLDDAQQALQDLAQNLDLEEAETRTQRAQEPGDGAVEEGLDDEQLDGSVEGWVDERLMLSSAAREKLDADIHPVRMAIVKLRKFAYAVLHSSTLLLPLWFEILESLGLSPRTMPRDVATRWNSTYDMLSFALEYRQAIARMSADADTGLRRFELDRKEWEIVGQLVEVLKVRTFTDTSETYRIAMILHPRYKLQYFRNRRWETDWIETAEEILRDEYKRSYGPLDIDNTADATSSGFDPGPGPSTVRVTFRCYIIPYRLHFPIDLAHA
ncbi:hypothetical protein DFP72DRAFT_825141 [Ephemerocybe angulata]|uniref:Uncharacterized protein n=1 Tax=Ephemerocybe angulata TaxID=980116 RepID=A0A8H6HD05_9AGAR|nr:hypothetical protein DFP72DRAFT_825141 [Tulosesus angulatus]